MTDFREGGGLFAPHHPPPICEQPRKSPSWIGLRTSSVNVTMYFHVRTESVNIQPADLPVFVNERLYRPDYIHFGIYFALCNDYPLTCFALGSLSTWKVESKLFLRLCVNYMLDLKQSFWVLACKRNQLINLKNVFVILTDFSTMFNFYTPWKCQDIFKEYRNRILCWNGIRSNILILRETSFKLKFEREKSLIKDWNTKYFCKAFI